MNTNEAIVTRKSPNAFTDAPLTHETIKEISEAGLYAPIFGKVQITVVESKEVIGEIDKMAVEMMKHSGNDFAEKMANTPGYSAVRNANAFVILSSPNGNDENGFNMANVSVAAENIILKATDLGIGSRFMMGPVMALGQEPIKSRLALPEGFVPLVVVALGNVEDGFFTKREKSGDSISYIK